MTVLHAFVSSHADDSNSLFTFTWAKNLLIVWKLYRNQETWSEACCLPQKPGWKLRGTLADKAPRLWNDLPGEIRSADSIVSLKATVCNFWWHLIVKLSNRNQPTPFCQDYVRWGQSATPTLSPGSHPVWFCCVLVFCFDDRCVLLPP